MDFIRFLEAPNLYFSDIKCVISPCGGDFCVISKYIQKIGAAILILSFFLLSGCSNHVNTVAQELQPLTNAPWMAGESPVPGRRTGLYRQGIYTISHSFECTSAGVYYLSPADDYILYCDHDSDTFVPLCNRPDCNHADYEGKSYYTCNAYFSGALSMCFYEGELYVLMANNADGLCVKKVKPDGTDRVSVWELGEDLSNYSSYGAGTLWNGILTYNLRTLDEQGNQVGKTYYYKLDGTMTEAQVVSIGSPKGNDGDVFIVKKANDVYTWDGSATDAVHLSAYSSNGYYGTEAAYIISEGVISKLNYTTGEAEALFDTGLAGLYELVCFPDCLVVYESLSFDALVEGAQLETQTLHFYNWAFDSLGCVTVENSGGVWASSIICGETANRIYLALEYEGIPSHYIDKSEFLSGNMSAHKMTLPTLPMLETGSSPINKSDW